MYHTISRRPLVVAGIAVVLLTSVWFVAGAPPASACSCASVSDADALRNADAVFTGTLVERIGPGPFASSSSAPVRLVFEVDRVATGDVFARQSVVTPGTGASCGLELDGPGPYLVFANDTEGLVDRAAEGELYVDSCSGTRSLDAGGLSAQFGPGAAPLPGESPIGNGGANLWPVVAASGAALLVGAFGLQLALRRRRRVRARSE